MFGLRQIPGNRLWTPAFEQSVICDGGASMTRTFTSTSGDSWAIALRRSKFGAVQNVISGTVYFDSSDRLVAFGRTSTRVFRDIGWYVFLFNPTSMYVNGPSGMDEVTGTGTYAMASIVNPVLCGTANRFEGALAGFWHADSVAWSVSDFVGSFTFDGQSLPIALSPSLTYGADGVRLLFADSAAFGDDTSGNGNNWTPTGFVAGDQTADVPGRPYNSMNPLDRIRGTAAASIGDGGFSVLGIGAGSWSNAGSWMKIPSGKWYAEIRLRGTGTTTFRVFGVASPYVVFGASAPGFTTAANGWGLAYHSSSGGAWYANSRTVLTGLSAPNDGVVARIAIDTTVGSGSNRIWFGEASWFNSGDPAADLNPIYSNLTSDLLFTVGMLANSGQDLEVNFGQRAFTYTPPTDFLPLWTGSLPTPSAPANPDTGNVTANANANGPSVYLGYAPSASDTLTLGGSAVTWGTHADRLSYGFKVRTASSPYNDGSGSKAYSLVTTNAQYGGGDAPWPLAQ